MKLHALVSIPQSIVLNEPESTETNQCLSVLETLATGPSSIDFPATSSALTPRIQETYHSFPNLVKLEIAALVLLPENQTIRVIWNHDVREWTYRGNDIPFVQFGFPGLRAVAKEFLHRAPCLYKKHYNLLVNYPTADFSFEYNRCGSRTEDDDEYLEAMQGAAEIVRCHNNERPNQMMRNLTLSWCPRHDDPRAVLRYFRNIPGLKKVDLVTHAHYRRGTGFDSNLRDEEEANDIWHVKNSLQSYRFEVRMFNHWGVQLGGDEDEEEDEW